MVRAVNGAAVRTLRRAAAAVIATGVLFILVGCPASTLLNEVKNRTEGSYTQLASLSLPAVTLTPSFSPSVTSYTATVGYTTTSVTLVPMSFRSEASITINGSTFSSGAATAPIPLNVGLNTISLEVNYTNAAATTYTIGVTRLSQVDLTTLAVTGASTNPLLSPPFRSLITAYTLSAANTETTVTITPTAADPMATVVINPPSPLNVSSLAVGATSTVTVTVTSPGGGGSRVYTIAVSRLPLGFAADAAWGSSGRVGPDLTGDARLYCPSSIAVGSGQVFIHDSRNFRIQNFDTSGNPVKRWGSYGSGSGQFNDTRGGGMAYYGGYIYDLNGGKIQKFQASNGQFQLQFGSGFDNSRIACDPSGTIYVADMYNSRVVKFDSNGTQLGVWTVGSQPSAIAADSSNVYVGEYGQIQKYTTTGVLLATWTTGLSASGLALAGSTLYVSTWAGIVSTPTSSWSSTTVVSGSNNAFNDLGTDGSSLYTLSGHDYRFYKYSIAGAAQGSWGSDLTTVPHGMKGPQRVVVDSSGNTYVSDTNNNRILRFNSSGGSPAIFGTGFVLSSPYGLAIDATNGWLYVADYGSSRIPKFNLSTGAYVTAITGLNGPKGVAVDGSQRLYVANTGSNSVLMYDSAGVPQGSAVTGFSSPNAVAVDASNNVYVADSGNFCIKKYTQNMGSPILQFGAYGYGNGKFSSIPDVSAGATGVFVSQGDYYMQQFDANGIFAANLPTGNWTSNSPQQLVGSAVDSLGNLYMVDATNCSVRKFKPQ